MNIKSFIFLTAVLGALLVFGYSNNVVVASENYNSNVNNNANANASANNQVQNMVNGNGASGSASGSASAGATATAGSSTNASASAAASAAAKASTSTSATTVKVATSTGNKVVAKSVKSLPATGAEMALLPGAMSAFALAARKYLLARKEASLLA